MELFFPVVVEKRLEVILKERKKVAKVEFTSNFFKKIFLTEVQLKALKIKAKPTPSSVIR